MHNLKTLTIARWRHQTLPYAKVRQLSKQKDRNLEPALIIWKWIWK